MNRNEVEFLDQFARLPATQQLELLSRAASVSIKEVEEVRDYKPNIDDIELDHHRKVLDLKLKLFNMAAYIAIAVFIIFLAIAVKEILTEGDLLGFAKELISISKDLPPMSDPDR